MEVAEVVRRRRECRVGGEEDWRSGGGKRKWREREREERKSEGRNAGGDGEVGRYLGT